MGFDIISTCPNPMAETTYLVFQLLFTGIVIGTTAFFWWHRNEVKRLDARIDEHDTFVNDTRDDMTSIKANIAGIQECVKSIDNRLGDLAELNRDVINHMMKK